MKYLTGFAIGVALTYGLLFTFDRIKGNTDKVYVDKPCPVCSGMASSTACVMACPVCVPYAEITGGKLYCDSSRYLETIKALNFRIADLKSCISEECLNFSSMPSKCK